MTFSIYSCDRWPGKNLSWVRQKTVVLLIMGWIKFDSWYFIYLSMLQATTYLFSKL